MKCALELIAIKEVAEAKYLMAEEIKDAETRDKFKTICNDTIRLCDTIINDELVNKANNRKNICASYLVRMEKDRIGNVLFRFIKKDGLIYADGTESQTAMGTYYSFETLKNYLTEHCITLDCYDDSYKSYGVGSLKCNRLMIYVPKK